MTGVEAALAEAFRHEWGRIVATLIGVTGDWDLAEECAQEAFAAGAPGVAPRRRPGPAAGVADHRRPATAPSTGSGATGSAPRSCASSRPPSRATR